MKAFFVSGTATGFGKTTVAWARKLYSSRLRANPRIAESLVAAIQQVRNLPAVTA